MRLQESKLPHVYFAYGSNMSQAQMTDRCPQSQRIGIGELVGYELCFPRYSKSRKCGVSGIAKRESKSVWGVLFELTDGDLNALDRLEGYNNSREKSKNSYTRGDIVVRLIDGTNLECFTYFANPQEGEHKPNAHYRNLIVEGAIKNKLPDEYISLLKSIAVC